MKNLKSCIISKSIVIALLLWIVFTVLGRIVLAGIICGTSMELTTKPVVYLLIMSVLYALSVVISVIVAQSSAAKKGCDNNIDNPAGLYLILMVIFLGVSVIISLLCITFNRDLFMRKSEIVPILQNYSEKYPNLTGQEVVDTIVGEFKSGVVRGSIIQNVVQAVLTFASVPICLKKHNNLF